MSPQTSRYPMPAAGDAAAPNGRHRRPESLADVVVPAPRTTMEDTRPTPAAAARTSAAPRVPAPRQARHQRNVRPGRHAAARTTATRPPVTGSHRAPGTLPIESWLLMGKTRQQLLLASLVAIGLLMIALPAEQRQSGVDAVNAAAQRAAGTSSAKKQPATAKNNNGGGDSGKAKSTDEGDAGKPAGPAPTASAKTPAGVPAVASKSPAARVGDGLGPGHSVRTTGSKAIALTFDDGPDPVQTPKILALLAENDVKATFCLVGEQAKKHPEIVRDIVAAGHTLCNHTWNHSLTIGKDKPEKIAADLARTNEAIRAAVPDAKIPYFRAPGGNFTERLVGVATTAGMASLYWEVDPRDWDHPEGETADAHVTRVEDEIRKNVRPGSIVLSHDFNQPDTILAYAQLIPWLKEHFTIGMPGGTVPPPVADAPASTPPASDAPAPDATTTPAP